MLYVAVHSTDHSTSRANLARLIHRASRMDSLLTEDDFNDIAAAVGEGADGSDADERVRRVSGK